MQPKDLAFAIGSGIVSALLYMSAILTVFVPLPLFLVGLGQGQRACALGCLAGTLMVGLVSSPLAGALFALTTALPVWLISMLSLMSATDNEGKTEWFPMGVIVGAVTVVGGMLFLTFAFYVGGGERSLEQMVQSHIDQMLTVMFVGMPAEQTQLVIGQIVPFFPAMACILWLLMIFANSGFAQTILHRSGKGIRPRGRLSDLNLPDWSSWLFVASAAATLIASGDMEYTMRNLTVVMAAPFFVCGLGLVHTVARTTSFTTPMLVVFYVFLIFVLWMAAVVAFLGLMDQWFGLRAKMRKENQTLENE